MTEPRIKPIVKLIDTDGNSLKIIQRVKDALLKAGADEEYILQYHKEAMAGDYNNLICVTLEYVHAI